MLKPQVVIFHEDDIDKIIQECLTYPYCKILIAVPPSDIKDTALKFLEHIDSKTLARRFRMSINCAIANFTNGAELNIISNKAQSRGHRASKIYCSPDTSIEVYLEILWPQILDYERILRNIKVKKAEKENDAMV
jgi:hypothetical protein